MTNQISQEKLAILDAIAKRQNIFITGSAGTGKSYLLRLIKDKYCNSGLHITASTGAAAVQVGGVTIHSWAALGAGSIPTEEVTKFILSGKGTRIRRKLRAAKLLAIDEVSMLSSTVMDMLSNVLKSVRGNQRPFGGIQLILIGDFFQLPPIVGYGQERKFAFEAEVWAEAQFQVFNLQQVYRQHDDRFIALLANVRKGQLSQDDLTILNNRKNLIDCDEVRPTILATHNRQVMDVNSVELNKLTTKEVIFQMQGKGAENKLEFLKKNCLAGEQLRLKVGAQVMMLKNTLQKEGIINGSLGVIKSFTSEQLPVVTFSNGKTLIIQKEEWAVEEFNEETKLLEIKAVVRQIPLILAWAMTVHKAQGMTLDKVECDLGSSFEEGQVYVALSRVVALEGLFLKSFNASLIKVNPKVLAFYNNL